MRTRLGPYRSEALSAVPELRVGICAFPPSIAKESSQVLPFQAINETRGQSIELERTGRARQHSTARNAQSYLFEHSFSQP